MIDFEKLNQAIELAEAHEEFHIRIELGCGEPEFALMNGYSIEDFFHSIDELIERLTPDTEFKYKVGQLVYAVNTDDEITSFVVLDIHKSGIIPFYSDGEYHWHESLLFPTRQALIEHQIQYWQSLSENKPFVAKLDRELTDDEKKIFQQPGKIVAFVDDKKGSQLLSDLKCKEEPNKPKQPKFKLLDWVYHKTHYGVVFKSRIEAIHIHKNGFLYSLDNMSIVAEDYLFFTEDDARHHEFELYSPSDEKKETITVCGEERELSEFDLPKCEHEYKHVSNNILNDEKIYKCDKCFKETKNPSGLDVSKQEGKIEPSKCAHEPMRQEDGKPYVHTRIVESYICKKCADFFYSLPEKNGCEHDGYNKCRKCGISLASNGRCGNLNCVDMNECEHERLEHILWSQCTKCGEFYI